MVRVRYGGGSTADVRKGDFRGREMSGVANVGEGQMSILSPLH